MDAEPQDTQTRALSGGKKASGKGCGCIAFLLVFLLGAALLGFWAQDDYRIFNEFVHATCTVTGKRVVEHSGSKGSTYHPEVDFTFEANGQTISATGYDGWSGSSSGREGKEEAIAPYQIGGTYDCWYDPKDPQRAVLVRRISWIYLVPIVLMAIGVFGGWLMLRKPSGPSPEAVLYKQQLKKEEDEALLETGPVAPGGGQGQTLAVRLEASVVWYTEGRGDKDEGAVWNRTLAENEELDSQRAFPLEIPMPESPWTYDGKLIKIRWVVRVRVKPQGESEIAGEKPFDLLPPGRVPQKEDEGADAA